MSLASQIARLDAHKQILVAESELNRRLLALEIAQLRSSVVKPERFLRAGRLAGPALLLLLPLIGRFFARRKNSSRGLLDTVLRGWELASALAPLWSTIRQPPA